VDSITQFVLGASIGEAVLGKKIGNKAILWGGLAGTIPDLDVLTGPFLDTVEKVSFHRSISHSIFLFIFLSPVLGYLISKLTRQKNTTFFEWSSLFFWGFLTHALLDCFTTWGTQLFWPHTERIAWKTIFVIDPVYTLPFILGLILIWKNKTDHKKRKRINIKILLFTSFYLTFTVGNKLYFNYKFEEIAKESVNQNEEILRIDTRPAPLQNILWTANVETKDNFYLFYHSYFDKSIQTPTIISKQHHLLIPYLKNKRVKKLIEICEGYYTIKKVNNRIVFNDLRFGQIKGWIDPESNFVFAYSIFHEDGEVKIEEIEKKYKDAGEIFSPLINRILGNF